MCILGVRIKMTKEKETEKLLDRLYRVDVAVNDLKLDFEIRHSKTRTDYETHYKGKELKLNLSFLDKLREERLHFIDEARMKVQCEIIGDYVREEMKNAKRKIKDN